MNCIIAQSGGPTTVINSSVYGVIKENFDLNLYENVYGGVNGIEGILAKKIINLSSIDQNKLEIFKNSPSSGLGSCRYKLKDFSENEEEYKKLISILREYKISTFFYVGGNDSMDTIAKLSTYAIAKDINIKFIGIPKTIDNDLKYIDHTPGFGSAAKFISTSVLETYLDSKVYSNNGIFILESMGRDTGWLAAAASLAKIKGTSCVDLIYLPESSFSLDKFIKDVQKVYNEKHSVYIVASEGLKNKDGEFLSATKSETHDNFGHSQLGGVGSILKAVILKANITKRVKVLELGVLQRCSMHCASETDLHEAELVGRYALKNSMNCTNGLMVSIKRISNLPYKSEPIFIEANKVANNIKYFPTEWINEEGNGVTEEALAYLTPLVEDLDSTNTLPIYESFAI
ncbi:6-phosphofructokinase [Clostridium massiliamazoniense]|uniref:6-phosphofructokinase n=1 Tax=Clostridium massiliamazoniense TaxID=1347366 RepID=UPI0006D85DC4|nr:6-phosphofructokinase [Clostridium massiliamazoniense]